MQVAGYRLQRQEPCKVCGGEAEEETLNGFLCLISLAFVALPIAYRSVLRLSIVPRRVREERAIELSLKISLTFTLSSHTDAAALPLPSPQCPPQLEARYTHVASG